MTTLTVRRAVYCRCCQKPTGEFIGMGLIPDQTYCDDCHNLPHPWRVERMDGGYVTVIPEGRVNVEGGARIDLHGDVIAAEIQGFRNLADAVAARDEGPPPPHCPNCDSTEIRFYFAQVGAYDVFAAYPDPGGTVAYLEHYETNTDNAETENLESVECSRCGYSAPYDEFGFTNWEWA